MVLRMNIFILTSTKNCFGCDVLLYGKKLLLYFIVVYIALRGNQFGVARLRPYVNPPPRATCLKRNGIGGLRETSGSVILKSSSSTSRQTRPGMWSSSSLTATESTPTTAPVSTKANWKVDTGMSSNFPTKSESERRAANCCKTAFVCPAYISILLRCYLSLTFLCNHKYIYGA